MSNIIIDKINGILVSDLSGDGSWSPKTVDLRSENIVAIFESNEEFSVCDFTVAGAFFPVFPTTTTEITQRKDVFIDYSGIFNMTVNINVEPVLSGYKYLKVNETIYHPIMDKPFSVNLIKGINKIEVCLAIDGGDPDIKSTYPQQFYKITDTGTTKHVNLFNTDNKINESLIPTEFKTKKLVGTMPDAQGKKITIAHELKSSKIISVSCLVEDELGSKYTQNYRVRDGFEYGIVVNSSYINVEMTASNSANLIGKPFSMYVVYEH